MPSSKCTTARTRLVVTAAFASLTTLAVVPIAHAQDAAMVTARRDLLDQAQHAREQNDHRRALDLAQRAAQIQMTPSLRFFIAEEQQALGLYVEATGNAEVCAREADRDTALRNRESIVNACRNIAQTARTRVAHVTVQLPAGAPDGVRIVVAGTELNRALVGVPYTVNPGTVVIEATSPGSAPFRRELNLAVGGNETVAIELGATASTTVTTTASSGTSAIANTASGTTATSAGAVTQPEGPPRPHPPAGSLLVTGVGAFALVGGVVLLALNIGRIGQFERAFCDPVDTLSCSNTPEAHMALDDARTINTVGWAVFGAGAALAAGGAIWAVLGYRDSAMHPYRRARIQFAPTADGFVFGIGGSL